MAKNTKSSKVSVHEIVSNRFIEMLEQGVVPWRRPWNNFRAVNWVTQKPYRGINTLLLEPGEYATFKQISEAGGRVKAGAKSQIVVFWKKLEREDKKTGETETFFLLRYYRVFEINTQCEGLTSKRNTQTFEHNPIEEAEALIASYPNQPAIDRNGSDAHYSPLLDRVVVPASEHFPKIEEFYCTLFHELIHSTGAKKRLNRPGIAKFDRFGSEQYSKEELIAEIGAAIFCSMVGIDNSTIDNSASYIASWLRKLKDDKTLIVTAAGQAQKAVDYITGAVEYDEPTEPVNEEEQAGELSA